MLSATIHFAGPVLTLQLIALNVRLAISWIRLLTPVLKDNVLVSALILLFLTHIPLNAQNVRTPVPTAFLQATAHHARVDTSSTWTTATLLAILYLFSQGQYAMRLSTWSVDSVGHCCFYIFIKLAVSSCAPDL